MSLFKYIEATLSKENIVPKGGVVVIYAGRFSPPHNGHLAVYNKLCVQWGKDNIWILTAEGKGDDKNPFSFQQKKEMLIAAGAQQNRIVKAVGSMYKWETAAEVTGADPEHCALVTAMGEKDAERLGGKYYIATVADITARNLRMAPMKIEGYIQVIENEITSSGEVANATSIRQAIADNDIARIKGQVPDGVYNWLLKKNTSESIIFEEEIATLASGIRKIESALGVINSVMKAEDKEQLVERRLERARDSLLAAAEDFGPAAYNGIAHEGEIQEKLEWSAGILASILSAYDEGTDNPVAWTKDCKDVAATISDTARMS